MSPTRFVRVLVDGTPRHGCFVPGAETIALLDGDPILGAHRLTGEVALEGARLLVPCAPSKILGVGTNYRRHAEEMGKPIPDEPLLFLKPPSALLDPGQPIVRPRGYERVDFEGELCVVIGRRAHRVREEQALDFIFGYTILNDVSVRDLQKKDGQFTRAKGFDSFAPVGPWIVPDLHPGRLRLQTRVNGALVQDSSTEDLIFSVPRLVAFASHVMTLLPGDLLTTGTPAGVGNLAPGDTVCITIDQIGSLENPVVEAPLED